MDGPVPDNVRSLRPRRTAVAAVEHVILRRRLGEGDPLPSATHLARTLELGIHDVQHALEVLESMYVLRHDDGRYVVTGRSSALVDRLVRLRMSLSGFDRGDLMAIRIDLERGAAVRAAAEAAPADLASLHEVVAAMAEPDVSPERFSELDREFHTGLARAGRNELATLLLTSLGDAVQNEMRTAYGRMLRWPHTATRLAEEHRRILAAVEQGAAGAASEAITAHIGRFYDLQAG